jgi:hypothetical protein
LNPHWVSRMCPTPTIRKIVCRPYMRMLRRRERCGPNQHRHNERTEIYIPSLQPPS